MALIHKILLIVVVALTFNSQAHAITLGVEMTNYEPYYYLNKENEYRGAAREIFDLFFNSNQLKGEYFSLPVPRLFNEFEKGHLDLKFPDNPLWAESLQSDVEVFYSDPIFNITESLLILKQAKPEIDKKDIKSVGTILGFSVPGIAKSLKKGEFTTTQTRSIEQLLHMLVSKRVQAVYFNKHVAEDLITQLYPKKSLVEHSQYAQFNYAYHLSSIKHPKLIKLFNSFLISHATEIQQIKKRYNIK